MSEEKNMKNMELDNEALESVSGGSRIALIFNCTICGKELSVAQPSGSWDTHKEGHCPYCKNYFDVIFSERELIQNGKSHREKNRPDFRWVEIN